MLLQEATIYSDVPLHGFLIKRNKKGAPLGTPFLKYYLRIPSSLIIAL